jgi:hypothetical protein
MNDLQRFVAIQGISSSPARFTSCRVTWRAKMRVSAQVLLCCLTAFLFFYGCSDEEELPPPRETQKVTKSVPKAETVKANPATAAEGEKPPAGKKAEETTIIEGETGKAHELPKEQKEPEGVEGGYYIVKKGDTLAAIAARRDVYQDYLKWPILLRFNLDQLSHLPVDADFQDKELPAGMKIKIVPPQRVKTSSKKGGAKIWVVNVLSSKTKDKIVPPAVTLIEKGYPMYIVQADVKGEDWMRLRMGFFDKRAEADELGKKIKDLMNFKDSWTARVDNKEYEEFGGF